MTDPSHNPPSVALGCAVIAGALFLFWAAAITGIIAWLNF